MKHYLVLTAVIFLTGCSSDYYKAAFEGNTEAYCRMTYRQDDHHREQHERLLAIVSSMTDAELSERASLIEPRGRGLPKTRRPAMPSDEVALPYYVSYEYGRRENELLPYDVEYDARISLIGHYLRYPSNYRILSGRLGTPARRIYCSTYIADLAAAETDIWECKAGVGSCSAL